MRLEGRQDQRKVLSFRRTRMPYYLLLKTASAGAKHHPNQTSHDLVTAVRVSTFR